MAFDSRSNISMRQVIGVLVTIFIAIQLFSGQFPHLQVVDGALARRNIDLESDTLTKVAASAVAVNFRHTIDHTINKLKLILTDARHPTHASDVAHVYADKYELAEWLTNTAVAAQLNVLESLGVDETALSQMVQWSQSGNSVSLRFSVQPSQEFLREETHDAPDDTKEVTTTILGSFTRQRVHTVHDFYHRVGLSYQVTAFPGVDPSMGITVLQRKGEIELAARWKLNSAVTEVQDIDVNISWLLKRFFDTKVGTIKDDATIKTKEVDRHYNFTIDRTSESCRTPRRNVQIDDAIAFGSELHHWCTQVRARINPYTHLPYSSIDFRELLQGGQEVFNPIAPLLEPVEVISTQEKENSKTRQAAHEEQQQQACANSDPTSMEVCQAPVDIESPARLLSPSDVSALLREHQRTLRLKLESFAHKFSETSNRSELMSITDARLLLVTHHLQDLLLVYEHSVYSIEAMLHEQLVAAVGKEMTSDDFDEFMRFHYNQLFREEYRPKPFVFAVRRPEHYPEGTISIEAKPSSGSVKPDQPILTSVRTLTEKDGPAAVGPMSFPLSASTRVSFFGDRYLHSYLAHEFASPDWFHPSQNKNRGVSELTLKCRSRAFSSYIVLLGTMSSSQTFEPSHAFILQNKEEMEIPLTLTQIPSAAAFESAISSLSEEQQRFAKAIRAMQLESSLFAVLLVQLKPALELLLHLPADSLTKEIQLTQDLLELFIEYQIPSDLLTFDGAPNATKLEKLDQVKGYVRNIQAMLETAKKERLEEAKAKAEFAQAEQMAEEELQNVSLHGREYLRMAGWEAPKSLDLIDFEEASVGNTQTTGSADSAQQKHQLSPASPTKPMDPPISSPMVDPIPSTSLDLTALPGELDKRFLAMDVDSALRSTKITLEGIWQRLAPSRLNSRVTERSSLDKSIQESERNRAFDLIDALSRSGAIPLNASSLHIFIATTHAFDKSLISTVVQQNVNPIEKLDRSVMLIAHLIQGKTIEELVQPSMIPNLIKFNPAIKQLMDMDASNNLAQAGK